MRRAPTRMAHLYDVQKRAPRMGRIKRLHRLSYISATFLHIPPFSLFFLVSGLPPNFQGADSLVDGRTRGVQRGKSSVGSDGRSDDRLSRRSCTASPSCTASVTWLTGRRGPSAGRAPREITKVLTRVAEHCPGDVSAVVRSSGFRFCREIEAGREDAHLRILAEKRTLSGWRAPQASR